MIVSLPQVVGRERELATLREAASQAPALVTVTGVAGIGKSRLLREVLEGTEQRRTLLGRCHPAREPAPLAPVIAALRGTARDLAGCALSPLAGALRPLLPELGACLPGAPPPLADARAQRHRTFRALRELLEAPGATVCALEDLHWADADTLEFLAFLLSEPPRQLTLLLTYRHEELDETSSLGLASRAAIDVRARAIELAPLCEHEVGTLASALAGGERLPQAAARALHALTDGIPFVVEQVVRLLAERDELPALAGGRVRELEALAVGAALRAWLLEPIERLDADAQAIARAAAVLREPAPGELLREVAGLPAARADRALVTVLRRGALAEQGRGLYGLRHSLAARVVLADMPTPHRERLHLRAARALEARAQPRALARIAHHHREGGSGLRWVRYAEVAAEAAHRAADDRAAMELLQEALEELAVSRAARIRMALALGTAALYHPAPQRAIAALQRVLDQEALPRGVRGELRFSLCRLRWHAGQPDAWHEEMLLAVDELRRRPALAARAMINLAQPTRLTDGDVDEHLDWLWQAERVAARQDDPVATIAVSMQRAAILLGVGDPAGWDAAADAPAGARSVDEKLQLRRGYHSLANAALELGHLRRAEAFLHEAERIHAELRYESGGVALAATRIGIDCAAGRWQGLEPRARACGEHNVVARLLVARGELAEAGTALAQARARARCVPFLADALAMAARISLHAGDRDGARATVMAGLSAVRRKGAWAHAERLAPDAIDVLIACADGQRADALRRELAEGLRGRDAPAAAAALAYCEGALSEMDARLDDAARGFARAERRWRALPRPYEAARARERRARCLLGGEQPAGRELLLAALADFHALGATWDATRVRAALRAEGVALPYPWRGGPRSYGNELSPREAQVARRVCKGETNPDIARTLFISPRTVDHHVSSAMRKLGVRSRRELAGALSARGING